MRCVEAGGVVRADDGHCYLPVVGDPLPWNDARTACLQSTGRAGFDLVALSTIEEIVWLQAQPALLAVPAYWTGGTDIDEEGAFLWTNGEPWIYGPNVEPWATAAEPSGGAAENCVEAYDGVTQLAPTWVLNDLYCDWAVDYICEWTSPAVDSSK